MLRVFESLDLRYRDDRLQIGKVARREHLRRRIDAPDAPVRHRAAHERHLDRARQADVGDELPAAVQMPPVFFSSQRGADAFALLLHQSCVSPISFTSLPYFWMSASRILLNSAGPV